MLKIAANNRVKNVFFIFIRFRWRRDESRLYTYKLMLSFINPRSHLFKLESWNVEFIFLSDAVEFLAEC